jgi:hypothetical protein
MSYLTGAVILDSAALVVCGAVSVTSPHHSSCGRKKHVTDKKFVERQQPLKSVLILTNTAMVRIFEAWSEYFQVLEIPTHVNFIQRQRVHFKILRSTFV